MTRRNVPCSTPAATCGFPPVTACNLLVVGLRPPSAGEGHPPTVLVVAARRLGRRAEVARAIVDVRVCLEVREWGCPR